MKYLPIFVSVTRQRIVICGGGRSAVNKLRVLLKTAADITVVAAEPDEQIRVHARAGRLELLKRVLLASDLKGARLAYIANDDVNEDRRIRAICQQLGVLANSVDNAGASDFISPAIVDRDPVVVAIGSEGAAPMLVRQIKARVEKLLDTNTGALARLARRLRPRVMTTLDAAGRRAFWRSLFARSGPRVMRRLGEQGARRFFHAELARGRGVAQRSGMVSLVGAGPGDPDLLTTQALRCIDRADVVLYDRLVDRRILDLVRREALQVEVGKTPKARSWHQDDINAAMINHAAVGRHVVRLKSGDPMIFARADEEIAALDQAGIEFEVIPGLTAAAVAAARIGASLTQRGRNTAVALLTAHDERGFAELDWRMLAKPGAVSAVYMGVSAARFVQGRLLLHGASDATAVTVVENISRANETRTRNSP